MGMPIVIRFADGTERCAPCKGFGLVRGQGARAGAHYKTFKGAQEAQEAGRAVDCPSCAGCGIIGLEKVGA